MKNSRMWGHLCACFCVVVWGTTFLASKVLLEAFLPVQIVMLRFLLAYIMLWVICPKWSVCWKDEAAFLGMAFFGNTLYYMAENTALIYSYTTNVSILVSAAPMITAVMFLLFLRDDRPGRNLLIGIVVSFAGMSLVVLNGSLVLKLSPIGDLLSIGAATSWGFYSMILKRYSTKVSSVFLSRKLMFYGMLTSMPILLWQHQPFTLRALLNPLYLVCVLFLGLIGSGLCYIAWNKAAANLGVLQTNLYIYAIPFVTLIAGAIAFSERITIMAVGGAILIAVGMIISVKKESK